MRASDARASSKRSVLIDAPVAISTRWLAAGGVVSRIAAGILGGYWAAYGTAALLSVTLPLGKTDATTLSTILALPAHLIALLWAFGARTALRAWIGIAGGAILSYALAQVLAR